MAWLREAAGVMLLLTLCAGCASWPGAKSAPSYSPTSTHKPPPVNLAGFPPAYKQGYSDACASAKDVKRFKADQQYAQGWRDGLSGCRASAKTQKAKAGNG